MRRKIVICDDEPTMRQTLCEYTECAARDLHETFDIIQYVSAEQLLADYPADMDILLLDIKMGELTGMEAARRIRASSSPVLIIFITSMPEYAIEGYDVNAYAFLSKPLQYELFRRKLKGAILQLDLKNGFFLSFWRGGVANLVNANEILYVEIFGHTLSVCTAAGKTEYTAPLRQVELSLEPRGFFRCHKSYLVNLREVKRIEQTDLLLSNGDVVPLSRHRRKELLIAVANLVGGNYGS